MKKLVSFEIALNPFWQRYRDQFRYEKDQTRLAKRFARRELIISHNLIAYHPNKTNPYLMNRFWLRFRFRSTSVRRSYFRSMHQTNERFLLMDLDR